MDKQKELEKLLSCVICQEKFKKTNKPLIMFCGHNICEECKLKHFSKVTCSICKKVFSKREIKKFPINYSILENKYISQDNEIKTNQESQENYLNNFGNISPNIDYNFVSTFLNEASKFIDIDKIQNDENKAQSEIDDIINKRELIIKETKEYIKSLEENYSEYSNKFFSHIIKGLAVDNKILIKDLNIAQLLEETGIINYGDMIKLGKFMELVNEIKKEDLMNCNSFEQIYNLIKEKNKDIKYESFISYFFFFNKVYELKIKKMDKIMEAQKKIYSNKKESYKNLCHFITNFIQKYESNLSDMFYDITTYKSCHFIYDIAKNENIRNLLNKYENSFQEFNNVLILYEPIEKKLNICIIKIKELKEEKIVDSYIFWNYLLFILTNKKLYVYRIKDGQYSSINLAQNHNVEENSKIIKYDIHLMILSSNYFQSINLRKDMTKNDWRSISLYQNSPGIIKHPYPICHSPNLLYILDKDNKQIKEIFTYNPDTDLWDKKEIKLEINSKNDENNKINETGNNKNEQEELIIIKQLLLEDYYLFNKCYACIWGGRHPVTKIFNKNVYMIDLVKGIIKKIINFDEFIKDDMIIIDLNVGILYKYVDFIFIYYLINDDKNIKIKVIRKEIIENDISIYTKLNVLMDVNLSEISCN